MKISVLVALMLLAFCFSENAFAQSDQRLFQNYTPKEVVLLKKNFLGLEKNIIVDSVIVKREEMFKSKGSIIAGELFDALFNMDLINEWNVYKTSDINPYSSNREEFVEKRKEELELKLIGEIKIFNSFNSFLILVSYRNNSIDPDIFKTVFLINVVDENVTSITLVSRYTCFNGDCNYRYTEMSKKGIFIQKEDQVSSDVIFLDGEHLDERKINTEFYYDTKGRLIVVSD